MDFLKRLYGRFVPWYDEEEVMQKEVTAYDSEREVKILVRDAQRLIDSYKRYDIVADRAKVRAHE